MVDTPLYLYNTPFVMDTSDKFAVDHILPYLDETDRVDERKIHALLMKFAMEEKLVEIKDNNIWGSIDTDSGSWQWHINHMNFRSLVVKTHYAKLMNGLQANAGYGVDQIIDLYTRLGTLFNDKLLNTLVNRTFKSLMLIPYEIPKNAQTVTWDVIHKETPFVWICVLIQTVIRSEARIARPTPSQR